MVRVLVLVLVVSTTVPVIELVEDAADIGYVAGDGPGRDDGTEHGCVPLLHLCSCRRC